MDNDILINQARRLYAALLVMEVSPSIEGNAGLTRLDRLTIGAYCRYQRRLNRCVVCYQQRTHDCIREPGKKTIPCARRKPSKSAVPVKD